MNLCINIKSFNTNTDSLLTDNYDSWHREIKKKILQMKRDCAFEVFVLQEINSFYKV